MKKSILAIFLAMAMCALLCACGAEESTASTAKEPSIKEQAIALAEREVRLEMKDKCDASGGITCKNALVNEVEDNKFEISGKVYAKDKYGNLSWADYDVRVTYYESLGKFHAFASLKNVKSLK